MNYSSYLKTPSVSLRDEDHPTPMNIGGGQATKSLEARRYHGRKPVELHKLKIKTSCGFTLVELLVAVTLFAVVITIGTSVLLSIVKSNNKARLINRLRNDGTRVMEELEREIKASDEAQVPISTTLDLRQNGNEYYRYIIIDNSGSGGNNYIKKISCTGLGVGCTIDLYTLTPTDSQSGLNIDIDGTAPDAGFVYLDHGEVRITLIFIEPVALPSRPDYQANVTLTSSVLLRNY